MSKIKDILPTVYFVLFATLVSAQNYQPDKVIIKVKEQYRSLCSSNQIAIPELKSFFDSDVANVEKKFPEASWLSRRTENLVDLSLIYELKLREGIVVSKAVHELENMGVLEYAEPKYFQQIAYTPNDPNISQQSYLSRIKAFQGWDIQKGNANITIGVVDTGTDFSHPEQNGKLKENSGDPINGTDDDGNGYIDDFRGWDFTKNDNDPSITFNDHGLAVAGVAIAKVDNNVGIAGVGFNCTYIPIKVGEYTRIDYGYEGIKYAADRGVDIINCSWGSFSSSQFEQDVINYAVLTKGALVVAAAGNQGREIEYYPAAYDNVLAVASTNDNDTKASFSNYGFWVDVSAPGNNIYTTAQGNKYREDDGTSVSAPMVSAVAGLIKAQFPALSGRQLGEKIKAATDNIYGVNPTYVQKLGTGRLNMLKGLSNAVSGPGVDISEKRFIDNNDNALQAGDTTRISAKYTNLLAPSGNLTVKISTSSVHVNFLNDEFVIGTLGTKVSKNNHSSPFEMVILSTAPKNEAIALEIKVSGGGYSKTFYHKLFINVDYLNVEVNKIGLTATSRGLIGYNKRDQKEGIGARLNGGETMLFEGGLMVGAMLNNNPVVVDNIRNGGSNSDKNFFPAKTISSKVPTNLAFEAEASFTDTSSFGDKLKLKVDHRVKAWNASGHQNYIVLEYDVINIRGEDLKEVFVGLSTDFDVPDYQKNRFTTNNKRFLGYTYSTQQNKPVAGVQVLSHDDVRFYGIDNVNGGNGGVNIFNGYFSDEKYQVLSTYRFGAGLKTAEGNDIMQVVSAKVGDLKSGDTTKVAFAFILANDTNELYLAADSAYQKFNNKLPNSIKESQNFDKVYLYPNPVGNELNITLGNNGFNLVEVISIEGKVLIQKTVYPSQKEMVLDVAGLPVGFHWVRLSGEKKISSLPFAKTIRQ